MVSKKSLELVAEAYLRGIEFVALNLDVGSDAKEMESDVTIITLSEAFNQPAEAVVTQVLSARAEYERTVVEAKS